MSTPRKTRSDKKIGTIEKEMATKLYNSDGHRIPKNMTLGDLRKAKQTIGFKRKVPIGELTEDQRLGSKILILVHVDSNFSDLKKIRQAIRSLQPL